MNHTKYDMTEIDNDIIYIFILFTLDTQKKYIKLY